MDTVITPQQKLFSDPVQRKPEDDLVRLSVNKKGGGRIVAFYLPDHLTRRLGLREGDKAGIRQINDGHVGIFNPKHASADNLISYSILARSSENAMRIRLVPMTNQEIPLSKIDVPIQASTDREIMVRVPSGVLVNADLDERKCRIGKKVKPLQQNSGVEMKSEAKSFSEKALCSLHMSASMKDTIGGQIRLDRQFMEKCGFNCRDIATIAPMGEGILRIQRKPDDVQRVMALLGKVPAEKGFRLNESGRSFFSFYKAAVSGTAKAPQESTPAKAAYRAPGVVDISDVPEWLMAVFKAPVLRSGRSAQQAAELKESFPEVSFWENLSGAAFWEKLDEHLKDSGPAYQLYKGLLYVRHYGLEIHTRIRRGYLTFMPHQETLEKMISATFCRPYTLIVDTNEHFADTKTPKPVRQNDARGEDFIDLVANANGHARVTAPVAASHVYGGEFIENISSGMTGKPVTSKITKAPETLAMRALVLQRIESVRRQMANRERDITKLKNEIADLEKSLDEFRQTEKRLVSGLETIEQGLALLDQ